MKHIWNNLKARVPNEYKKDFYSSLVKENLLKSLLCACIVIILETAIYLFFNGEQDYNGNLILVLIIFSNIFFLPLLYYAYKSSHNTFFNCAVLLAYWLIVLSLACALSVFTQNKLASINTYIIGIFGMAAIICIPPIESLVLYSIVYMAFFFVLPLFQPDTFIIEVFRTNAFVMNVFAWILSSVVFKMRIIHFLNSRQIEEKNELLKDMVRRDSMTSLLNHETSYKVLYSELARAKQIAYPLSLIMIDIDNFKLVNDRYGHIAGDRIIKRVACVLLENCRKTDIICRYGGEEFLIILPNTNLEDSVMIANRIRDTIEKFNMENDIQFTISGGICELENEKSVEELIKKADLHLYAAKSNGKNRFETASAI